MPTTSALDDPVIALGEQHEELAGVLAALTDDDWMRPTRCTGWTVTDVVLHLAQSDQLAIASLEGHFAEALAVGAGDGGGAAGVRGTVDDWAAASVAAEHGVAWSEVRRRWSTSARDLGRMLHGTDGHRRVPWVGGDVSVTTLATTRLAEAWIHTGDVADAVGTTLRPDERLRHVARLAWRTLPYAFTRAGRSAEGSIAFHLQGPRGDTWDFVPKGDAATVISGDGVELCEVAAQRRDAGSTSLQGTGPDATAALELVRTYA